MPFYYDVKQSQNEALKDSLPYNKNTFKTLLATYQIELNSILDTFGNIESNIPLSHRYYYLRNKFQFVNDKFTKE